MEVWAFLPIVLSNYSPPTEAPSAPVLDSISNPDEVNHYTVSWSAVSGASSYTLEEDDNAAFASPETVYFGAGTSKDITNQGPGEYYYRVKASNAVGESDWSNTESVLVWVIPPSVPMLDPISNPNEVNHYTVSWSAVSGASSYTLEEDDNPAFSSPETVYSDSGTSTDITDQGLGEYYYRVKASNIAGDSDWSNSEAVTVTVIPPAAPVLDPISNPDGDGNYTVSWSTVSGATSYTLEEDDNPAFSSPEPRCSGPDTSCPITNQEPGEYYYRVKASNIAGDSGWSNSVSVTVTQPPCMPTPGHWTGGGSGLVTSVSFDVASDSSAVSNFSISWAYPGACGMGMWTYFPPRPIDEDCNFSGSTTSGTETFAWTGHFDTPSTASGTWSVTVGTCHSDGTWDAIGP
jgi:hypothetical protein